LDYSVVRSKRKTISLVLKNDCTLEVRSPHKVSDKVLEEFVQNKQQWIKKAIERQSQAIKIPEFSKSDFEQIREKTLDIVGEFLNTFSGRKPDSIVIKRQKSVWGTCNSKGKISINVLVGILPRHLFEYVMIHELCHLEHLNHSTEFWNLVSVYIPDWKQRRLHLKKYKI
jgi:predicted metal-dependent hydrolase